MLQENNFEIKLSYEDFVNIKKMLYSTNVADSDMALEILQNSEPKKVLPYVLFIIMETSWIRRVRGSVTPKKDDPGITILFRLYNKVHVCKGLKKITDNKAHFYESPFVYGNYKALEKVVSAPMVTSKISDSIIDHMSRFITIKHIVDSIAIQDNPEEYYMLEQDINKYIKDDIKNCISNSHKHNYFESTSFYMHYDLKSAVEKTINNYDKT